jgi:hypothetical protein
MDWQLKDGRYCVVSIRIWFLRSSSMAINEFVYYEKADAGHHSKARERMSGGNNLTFYLAKSIFSEMRSNEMPKILSSITFDKPVANLAPSKPPSRKPRQIKPAIFIST